MKTSNLSFNRDTGEASTSAPVEFSFPAAGTRRGRHLQHAAIRPCASSTPSNSIWPLRRTGGMPVSATGSSLEISRNQRQVVLDGPAIVREGARELSAEKISVELDDGQPRARCDCRRTSAASRASRAGARSRLGGAIRSLSESSGRVERIVADGDVSARGRRLPAPTAFRRRASNSPCCRAKI